MKYGLLSGITWGLNAVILGIALSMAPYVGTAQAIALGAIVSAFLHDAFAAGWMTIYMATKGRLNDTLRALKTRSGKVVMIGALMGGPIGMGGYLVAINHIGASRSAIISTFYPAFGAFLAFMFLKERMRWYQLLAFVTALGGIVAMGILSATDESINNPVVGLIAISLAVIGWGSEAVFSAWGMRDDAVDNETALHIREITSALAYAFIVIPMFGAWAFIFGNEFFSKANGTILLAALAGTISYIVYYKGISIIGAAKTMAVNISYSAWAVLFAFLILGDVPDLITVILCFVILFGTIFSAADARELFARRSVSKVEVNVEDTKLELIKQD
ncbi:MAG: DMT family transporter [Actinomycetaceae bacterium]|nr:DMT family transporter [Actinomycetaceae bacterium]